LNKQFEGKKVAWEEEKSQLVKRAEEQRGELQREIAMKKEQLQEMDEENTELVGTVESVKEQLEKLKQK
jgi:hypothetical protein